MGGRTTTEVDLVQVYPELGERLGSQRRLIATAATVPRGEWTPPAGTGSVGWLVVDGVLLRKLVVGGGASSELIGPGDLIRPWSVDEGEGTIQTSVRWDVLEPAALVPLPSDLGGLATPLLEVAAARALSRIQRLGIQGAIAAQVGVERRVLLMLHHLADRWGRVRRDGVVLPIRLSHATLAQLVCARRPTVSTALTRLVEDGAVHRLPDSTWLLRRGLPG